MWLELKAESGLPLNRQIYERVKALILSGGLAAGEKLPSSRAFSKELGVARNTVLEAYEQLLAEGYLEARRGSGTTVAGGIAASALSARPTQIAVAASSSKTADGRVINFRSGMPDMDVFPRKEWGRLYQRVCEALPASAFRYCEPAGVWELREALSAYLFRVRGIRAMPERIMITSGSTQGLRLVSQLLRRENSLVLVEDPVHRGLVEVVARAGHTVRGIRADASGMDCAALPAGLEAGQPVAFVYVTPSHQYPLGGILPVQRRQTLIRFAHETECFIVEDDYDSEFRYEGPPVSSLYELAPDTVIYLGSFSKILAPAIRLGFAIIPEGMLAAWRPEKMYTDVHTDALSQHTLAAFINSGGLERHTWKMKKLYKRKREHMMRCLSQNFGGHVEIRGQAAGLHLVAGFPGVAFTENVVGELYARGLKVVPVESYSLCRDGAHAHEVILGYAHLSEAEMSRGAAILRDCCRQCGKSLDFLRR
ncbi:MAG: PLP-dependent aminotransferase family protein [Candidatus Adiutrix sp.]|jgi:GntR family transcriptional regulator/MocR family aminotransferase|nr:PLP-dependent aminotransferase family protein [Candidatus Adiutrix sp.]